jgi:hypothetical protein
MKRFKHSATSEPVKVLPRILKKRSKSMLSMPKMASAYSLGGRSVANTGRENGGKTRQHRARNINVIITIARNQIKLGWKMRSGIFIIAVCKRGGCSMSRRLWRGQDLQTRNGDLVIADQLRSSRQASHLSNTTGKAGPRQQPGGFRGRTQNRQTVETEA